MRHLHRGGYSARSFKLVLEDQMPKIYEPGKVFMRDNARIHTAKIIKEYLEEMGIEVLD
jgi:hypothetical protein